jgi:hypothetical protein
MKAPMTLDSRVAEAIKTAASSAAIAALLDETARAVHEAQNAAMACEARAGDPNIATDRGELEDARYRVARLQAFGDHLAAAHAEALAREREAERRAAYEAVRRERDALAAELADVYPALAAELADLLSRIAANDARVAAVNRDKPAEAPHLLPAECLAREVPPNFSLGPNPVPRLVERVVLPGFAGPGWTYPKR